MKIYPEHSTTWLCLRGAFTNAMPRRLIRGTAISLVGPDDLLDGRGFISSDCAIPLLLEHDACRPVGRVLRATARGRMITFEAEVANDGSIPWAKDAWDAIAAMELTAVSVGCLGLGMEPRGKYKRWAMSELSICDEGLDAGARITRCWTTRQRSDVLYVEASQDHVIWGRPS